MTDQNVTLVFSADFPARLRMAMALMIADPAVTDIEVLGKDGEHGLGFHTDLPTREDEESWNDYGLRMCMAWPTYDSGGLLPATLRGLEDLGFWLHINECEGLENEGILNYRD